MAGKLYLLSTGYIPVQLEQWKKVVIVQRLIGIEEVKQLLANGFVSVVGHQSTAEIMSQILGITVVYNRQTIFLEPGDQAICFVLKTRPPEGRVLTAEELQQLGFYFIHAKVLSAQGIC